MERYGLSIQEVWTDLPPYTLPIELIYSYSAYIVQSVSSVDNSNAWLWLDYQSHNHACRALCHEIEGKEDRCPPRPTSRIHFNPCVNAFNHRNVGYERIWPGSTGICRKWQRLNNNHWTQRSIKEQSENARVNS